MLSDQEQRVLTALPELPDDMADAFDSLKLAILHAKRDGWRQISQRDRRKEYLFVERLAHKIDADVHDHLHEMSGKVEALQGWADSRDRLEKDDRQEIHAVFRSYNEALDKLRKDVEQLRPVQASPAVKTQPRPR